MIVSRWIGLETDPFFEFVLRAYDSAKSIYSQYQKLPEYIFYKSEMPTQTFEANVFQLLFAGWNAYVRLADADCRN